MSGTLGEAGSAQPATPSDSDVNELLLLAADVVDGAARILIQGRSHLGGLIAKGDRDYATRVDFQIEDFIRRALAVSRRDIPCLGEERGGHLDARLLWVLDPIDGTTNFIKGSPLCAISLALLGDGQPIFGIVALPLLGERYLARAGGAPTSMARACILLTFTGSRMRLSASRTSRLRMTDWSRTRYTSRFSPDWRRRRWRCARTAPRLLTWRGSRPGA